VERIVMPLELLHTVTWFTITPFDMASEAGLLCVLVITDIAYHCRGSCNLRWSDTGQSCSAVFGSSDVT
jgi:hypothetical protein